LTNKERKENWVVSEGFLVGGNARKIDRLKNLAGKEELLSPAEKAELSVLKHKFQPAPYLTGKKTLPTKAFTETGIDETKICILHDEYFHRKRQKELFTRPLVLIEITFKLVGLIQDHIGFLAKIKRETEKAFCFYWIRRLEFLIDRIQNFAIERAKLLQLLFFRDFFDNG